MGTGSAGALTIDHASQVQILCQWHLAEFSTVKTSGTNGADAIVQAGTNNSSGSATGITVTLGAFNNLNNATYGCFFKESGDQTSFAVGSGFTELSRNTVAHVASSEFKNSNDTSVDWTTISESSQRVAAAVEIAVLPSSGFLAFL